MTSQLVGLDINGLWDWAAVWDPELDEVKAKDAGVNGSVVWLACDPGLVIGGRQASVAPHGRGRGWGRLGEEKRRAWIAPLLAELEEGVSPERDNHALGALAKELAGQAGACSIAVPDISAFGESSRDRLLTILRETGLPQATLLWRSVAAVLGWLSSLDREDGQLRERAQVAILSLMRNEVQVADVQLVSHQLPSGGVWVPERRRGGLSLGEDYGVAQLASAYADVSAETLELDPARVLSTTMAPWRYAVGLPATPELVRLDNRTWRELPSRVEPVRPPPSKLASSAVQARLDAADIILIEGAAVGNTEWRVSIQHALGLEADDSRISVLPVDVVARGCLEAGIRRSRGIPGYFDYLPQIEINALVGDDPAFVPLIPPGARVPGGATYTDKAYGDFAINPGASELIFYLLKEDFANPRKATVTLSEKPTNRHKIDVVVEQSPGQGYARVRIISDTYLPFKLQPVELDWRRMEVVDADREALLAQLGSHSRHAYPDAGTIPGHAIHWHPRHRAGDLCAMLRAYLAADLVRDSRVIPEALEALSTLRERVSRPCSPAYEATKLGLEIEEAESRRCLSSHGELPPTLPGLSIPEEANSLVERAAEKAATEFDVLVQVFGKAVDGAQLNHAVGMATWCFWQCPDRLVDRLLDVYESSHPLPINQVLLVEGLGRTIRRLDHVDRFVSLVDQRLSDQGKLRHAEYAALGRILGGIDAAADCVPQASALRILQATCELVEEENNETRARAYKKKFKFALLMLAVLLRLRRREPEFLAPSKSRTADTLIALLDQAIARCNSFASRYEAEARRRSGNAKEAYNAARRLRRNAGVADELRRFIYMEGQDPNIIVKIEDL